MMTTGTEGTWLLLGSFFRLFLGGFFRTFPAPVRSAPGRFFHAFRFPFVTPRSTPREPARTGNPEKNPQEPKKNAVSGGFFPPDWCTPGSRFVAPGRSRTSALNTLIVFFLYRQKKFYFYLRFLMNGVEIILGINFFYFCDRLFVSFCRFDPSLKISQIHMINKCLRIKKLSG